MSASPKPTSRAFSREPPPGAKPISTKIHAPRISCLLSYPLLALAHVAQALAGNRLRIGLVVEHLDRYPAGVRHIQQRLEDRHKVRVAETRAAQVGIVRVEMAHAGAVTPDQFRRSRLVGGHCLDVEM